MRNDEKRSHRLNYLLHKSKNCKTEHDLFLLAKGMGVSDETAHDYVNAVVVRIQQMNRRKEQQEKND